MAQDARWAHARAAGAGPRVVSRCQGSIPDCGAESVSAQSLMLPEPQFPRLPTGLNEGQDASLNPGRARTVPVFPTLPRHGLRP